jgi:hypothetical protein
MSGEQRREASDVRARAAAWILLAGILASASVRAAAGGETDRARAPVDFRKDIRPLFSDRCYTCHGPDEKKRKAGLRFDLEEVAKGELEDGARAVVPGSLEESELYARITSELEDERMPPSSSGITLSSEEIALFRRWIEEGATWQAHWSFVKPERPEPPAVKDASWGRGEIDRFVLAKLEEEGLAPSPQASRETLARRASFVLTGLPPTLPDLDAFLADESPDAYERYVERLFVSPHHGEHLARYWLDAARYGDTHGLHLDNRREMWRWRDWVIEALQSNMPFDRFTTEQLAGDLLPHPTLEQRIATGFNRCNPTSAEGGMIEEEFRVRYAFDRVDTTSTVWLGMTIECAKCHEHKFDPISQREYYQLYAFFASAADGASDDNAPAPAPTVTAPTSEEALELDRLGAAELALEARMEAPDPASDAAQAEWEAEETRRLGHRWTKLEPTALRSSGGSELVVLEDGSVLARGSNPERDTYEIDAACALADLRALRIEALPHASLPQGGAGRADNGNFVLTGLEIEARPFSDPSHVETVALAAAGADFSQSGYPVAAAIDSNAMSGWAIEGGSAARTAIFLAAHPFGFAGGTLLRIRLKQESGLARSGLGRFRISVAGDPALAPLEVESWRVAGPFFAADGETAYITEFGPERDTAPGATYEGGITWQERTDLVDGAVHELVGDNAATYLVRKMRAPSAMRLVLALGSDDAIAGWLDGERVLDHNVLRPITPDQDRLVLDLSAGEHTLLLKVVNYAGGYAFSIRTLSEEPGEIPLAVSTILERPAAERTQAENRALLQHFRAARSSDWRELATELDALHEQERELRAKLPTTLVMAEQAAPLPAHILKRGQYDHPGDEVQPGVPSVLPPLPPGAPANRLGLAQWLVDPSNPLTARVEANRLWQIVFGTGIVRTSGDFGARGEWPSHPELLDWLATELVASGWDVRHLLRLMVTSATFRQDSRVTPELFARDRENRLLARGPRMRLDAEEIRDNALAIAGLLVRTVGGPSVKPYQPDGLWRAVAYPTSNTADFVQDEGEALWRRSLYTFWKRTSPPPTMQLFDAPSRETCTVARARTNTPLQALATLNDVQFVEAARALGERMLREAGPSVEERVSFGFRCATARAPRESELARLRALVEDELASFAARPDAARSLVEVGDSAVDPALDATELAAWTVLASVLLNLDETLTLG